MLFFKPFEKVDTSKERIGFDAGCPKRRILRCQYLLPDDEHYYCILANKVFFSDLFTGFSSRIQVHVIFGLCAIVVLDELFPWHSPPLMLV